MDIQTWIFDRHLHKKEWGETVNQEKQLTVFVANDNIQAFKHKLEYWEACIHHHELDSFPLLKDFSDEMTGHIKECDFFYLDIV